MPSPSWPTSGCCPPTSRVTPAAPPSLRSSTWTIPARCARWPSSSSLLSVPSGEAFFAQAGPAFEAYGVGDHEGAIASFLGVVSGLDGDTCRAVLEGLLPGAFEQSVKDADTLFGVELPGLAEWSFGAEQAAAIECPVLSVLGSGTQPLWVDVAAFLRSSLPHVDECTIDGVGHLLHIERPEPVGRAIASFLGRHPITDR